jgi:hypothetical protein
MSKGKFEIKSIFEQISEQVFKMTDLNEAKQFVIIFVKEKKINEVDKNKILFEVNNAKTMVKFQTYICNALLRYESLGMNQLQKTSREAASESLFDE